MLPNTIVKVRILWVPDKATTVTANKIAETLKIFLEKKKISPRQPCKKTAKYAVKGVYGLMVTFIIITMIEAFNISPREENKDIREINIAANPLNNAPLKGILKACRIPPSTDSLNAHNAVILTTANDLSSEVRFSKVLMLNPI